MTYELTIPSRYIECQRSSRHPIIRTLPNHTQIEQKELIKRKLKPTVLLFKSEPHESAFALCTELFPTIKVIRFLPDPNSQDLDCVHASTSARTGESYLELVNRKVPHVRRARDYTYYDPHVLAPQIKVVEYLKKGFEYQDLNSLPARQIQSSIRVKGSTDLDFYVEDWKRYSEGNGYMPYLLSSRYMVRP